MFWSAGAATKSAFDRRGASWSVLDGNGKWNGKFGFRRLKASDCKMGPLAQFGRAPDPVSAIGKGTPAQGEHSRGSLHRGAFPCKRYFQ